MLNKTISTAARLHPNIVRHVHPPSRRPFAKWAKTTVALSAIAITTVYASRLRQGRAMAAQEEGERRRAVEDMYGARSSMEDLERAVAEYSKR